MTIDRLNDILVVWVLIPVLSISILLTFIRILRGPSLPDRVVAVDILGAVAVTVMAAYSVATEETVFLDVALVVALVSFLGTIGFAYYIDRRR